MPVILRYILILLLFAQSVAGAAELAEVASDINPGSQIELEFTANEHAPVKDLTTEAVGCAEDADHDHSLHCLCQHCQSHPNCHHAGHCYCATHAVIYGQFAIEYLAVSVPHLPNDAIYASHFASLPYRPPIA